MYPFSLTDCSVGRFIRNFISLVRTLFWSVSPAELLECVTLCLVAETFQTFIDTRCRSNWVKTDDVTCAAYIGVCQHRFRACRPEPGRGRRSSRTGLCPPRPKGGPGTPGAQINHHLTLSTSYDKETRHYEQNNEHLGQYFIFSY